MTIHGESKAGGRFNVIDALILLLVFALLVAMIFLFFFSDSGLLGLSGKKQTLRYRFSIDRVDNDLLSSGKLPMMPKDSFYLYFDEGNSAPVPFGSIETVGEAEPYLAATDKTDDAGNLVYAVCPGFSKFEFSVCVQMSVSDAQNHTWQGESIGVGSEFSFLTPFFSGVCRCVSVEEVAANES